MKDHLLFDTTSATTMADTDSVGAYLRASDGTLLTHTDVGGKKALDVRVAEGINVEVDLSHVDDSVKVGDGTDFLAINADGSINITDNGGSITVDGTVTANQGTSPWVIGDGGGSITVDASDLDIRDLTHVSDSIKVGDGTDFLSVNADGSINITDNGGSLTVDAVDLDIRDLAAATDSVSSWTKDGSGTSITSTVVGPDTGLDVNIINSTLTVSDAALANTAIASDAETLDVANTAQDVVASPLANRKYLFIYNNDNQKMYIGESGVSSSNGFPVSPGSYMELRCGAAVDIEFVSAKLNHEIRTLELS